MAKVVGMHERVALFYKRADGEPRVLVPSVIDEREPIVAVRRPNQHRKRVREQFEAIVSARCRFGFITNADPFAHASRSVAQRKHRAREYAVFIVGGSKSV